MENLESGTFEGTVPFVKEGNGDKIAVIFPGSMDLVFSVLANPEQQGKDARAWIPSEYTLYVLGYGDNVPPSNTAEILATRFARFVKEKIHKPITVIGISYGGFVAIPFASRFPELIEKLVFLVSAHDVSDSGVNFFKRCIKIMEDYKAGDEKAFDAFVDVYIWLLRRRLFKFLGKKAMMKNKQYFLDNIKTPENGINAYKSYLNKDIDLKRLLPSIKAPTYIIGGTNDNVFSIDNYKEVASLIPTANLILLKNEGHLVNLENPRLFRGTMKTVL